MHELWLLIAREDLDSAKHLLSASFITSLFHAQQCAEKSLKAYLIRKKNLLIKTHDLVRLLDICMESDRKFETVRLFAVELTPYETAGRYPDTSFIKPNQTDMVELIKQSESIFDLVRERLV